MRESVKEAAKALVQQEGMVVTLDGTIVLRSMENGQFAVNHEHYPDAEDEQCFDSLNEAVDRWATMCDVWNGREN